MNDTAETAARLTERLGHCYTGAVFDALRARGHRNCVLPSDITPLDPTRTTAGPVFPVRGGLEPDLDEDQSLLAWTEFLSRAPAGHVIVVEGQTDTLALMGELSAETLKHRGINGYVTDGGCRDCRFIQEIGFPVFSRYRTPRDIVGRWRPQQLGSAITLGGVAIEPGDYVLGDMDGVVIIPGALAETVISEVEHILSTENKLRAAILGGLDPREAYLRYRMF